MPRLSFAAHALVATMVLSPPPAGAAVTTDSGTFIIHKLQQRVGVEQYRTQLDGSDRVLTAETDLNYLGSPAKLSATLRLAGDGRPVHCAIDGQTSTMTRVDVILDLVVDGDPLARIGDIRRVHTVIAGGTAYGTDALWRAAGFEPRCSAGC